MICFDGKDLESRIGRSSLFNEAVSVGIGTVANETTCLRVVAFAAQEGWCRECVFNVYR